MKRLLPLAVILLMVSCIPGTPSEYIQPDDMEDILVDYHMARAMSGRAEGSYEEMNYEQALYIEAVLQKHGVTKAEFDSSLIYYYRRADRFQEIYQHVAERLEEKALVLGATEGEIGKFASLSENGDTANIWADKPMMALMPIPPYNRMDFKLEVDSTFKGGDSFLLQFMSDFMYQDGTRDGVVYVAVTYDNDTTISRNIHFSSVGLTQMRIPAYERYGIKQFQGFFFVKSAGDQPTTTHILFLNNIQLIRFHEKINEENKKDSDTPDSPRGSVVLEDDGGRDTGRGSEEILSLDTGTVKHRVVQRADLLEAR